MKKQLHIRIPKNIYPKNIMMKNINFKIVKNLHNKIIVNLNNKYITIKMIIKYYLKHKQTIKIISTIKKKLQLKMKNYKIIMIFKQIIKK